MSKPRLIYFDFAGSRGEECRMALHLAGVEFTDDRVQDEAWEGMKGQMPFGALPVLDVPGHALLAHSNAILVLIGRLHDLHPADPYQAAQHEALMCAVEELRHTISPTLDIKDPAAKRAAREALADNELKTWGNQVERVLASGPFIAGSKIHVADLKLYMIVRWLTSGTLDHVPKTVLDHCPKLLRLSRAVAEHPGIKGWMAKQ